MDFVRKGRQKCSAVAICLNVLNPLIRQKVTVSIEVLAQLQENIWGHKLGVMFLRLVGVLGLGIYVWFRTTEPDSELNKGLINSFIVSSTSLSYASNIAAKAAAIFPLTRTEDASVTVFVLLHSYQQLLLHKPDRRHVRTPDICAAAQVISWS